MATIEVGIMYDQIVKGTIMKVFSIFHPMPIIIRHSILYHV